MELFISITALVISLASIVFTIAINLRSLKTQQFQKLSDFRIKLDEVLWSVKYRLKDLNRFKDSIPLDSKKLLNLYQVALDNQNEFVVKLESTEKEVRDIYAQLQNRIRPFPNGVLEELMYNIESINISVDVTKEEIIPILKECEEDFKKIKSLTEKNNKKA